MERLDYVFFHRPCPEVARDLVGKILIHGEKQLRISETECYCGESDTACHASRGRTKRTEVMYQEAGTVYVYLCYGNPLVKVTIVPRGMALGAAWYLPEERQLTNKGLP